MNVEIAQRLAKLRRERGYSQEELAEKLGLSRQAVSKWERAESSPDTGNLVALANLYGVTLDELLRFDGDIEDDMRYEAQDRTASAEAKAQEAAERARAAAAQAAAAAAQVQAAQTVAAAAQCAPGAPVPPHAAAPIPAPTGAPAYCAAPPAPPTHPNAPGAPFPPHAAASPVPPQPSAAQPDGEHRHGSWSSFPYPILCVIVFLLAGFFWGIWHPAWIVFLTIPLYYYIAIVIDNDPNNRN